MGFQFPLEKDVNENEEIFINHQKRTRENTLGDESMKKKPRKKRSCNQHKETIEIVSCGLYG